MTHSTLDDRGENIRYAFASRFGKTARCRVVDTGTKSDVVALELCVPDNRLSHRAVDEFLALLKPDTRRSVNALRIIYPELALDAKTHPLVLRVEFERDYKPTKEKAVDRDASPLYERYTHTEYRSELPFALQIDLLSREQVERLRQIVLYALNMHRDMPECEVSYSVESVYDSDVTIDSLYEVDWAHVVALRRHFAAAIDHVVFESNAESPNVMRLHITTLASESVASTTSTRKRTSNDASTPPRPPPLPSATKQKKRSRFGSLISSIFRSSVD